MTPHHYLRQTAPRRLRELSSRTPGRHKPCDPEGQTRILLDALHVLETATMPGTLIQLPYKWDENDSLDYWEAEEMLHPSLM